MDLKPVLCLCCASTSGDADFGSTCHRHLCFTSFESLSVPLAAAAAYVVAPPAPSVQHGLLDFGSNGMKKEEVVTTDSKLLLCLPRHLCGYPPIQHIAKPFMGKEC